MSKLIVAIFAALYQLMRNLVVVGLAVGIGILFAKWFCNIDSEDTYSWISGIWHGIFVVPNYVRHTMDSVILYKAADYSTMYNIFWWIIVVLQIPTFITFIVKLFVEPIAAAFYVASNDQEL